MKETKEYKTCISTANLSDTGFSYTLSLINGKYKMTILYTLMCFGVVRFNGDEKVHWGNFLQNPQFHAERAGVGSAGSPGGVSPDSPESGI